MPSDQIRDFSPTRHCPSVGEKIMNKRITILVVIFSTGLGSAKPSRIIAPSNPRVTTHQLKSGNLTIGLTDNGGGIINQVILPGLGDIMDRVTDMYGRAGQVAIRDASHGGRYNPTQAGFNETLGTQCQIIETDDSLIVKPRGMALWHGDGKYDFTQWENIGDDPYREDGGSGDLDGLDENTLPGKQETEVYSEFDYYGTYQNYMGKNGIVTPAIRHYFEIRFIRTPGHCLKQFREGTPVWNGREVRSDISKSAPKGVHTGTDKDMNGLMAVWSLRHDISKWRYSFVYFRRNDGSWEVEKSTDSIGKKIAQRGDDTVFILADCEDPEKGIGLSLYRPKSDINVNQIVGINQKTGNIMYKDNRTDNISIMVNPERTPTMSKYGFLGIFSGMLNRTRLQPDIYEAFRSEFYIFSGTPQEIMDAIKLIDTSSSGSTIEAGDIKRSRRTIPYKSNARDDL